MVPYEIGEFIWPSIWVVVFAGLSLRVAVLAGDGCPHGGGSSGGQRAWGCIIRLVGWSRFVKSSRLSSGSSISSLVVMILAIADLEFGVSVWLCGGCLVGGGSSSGRQALCFML